MSEHSHVAQEPEPAGSGDIVALAVIRDLTLRMEQGLERYGTFLRTRNGRDALVDAYQEAIDLACYLKQALMEREGARP